MFVTIEFVGTMRIFVGVERCDIELEEQANVSTLLYRLKAEFSADKNLDESGILVLVNGREISVVNGLQTELKNNDVVTLISVSHGG